MSLSEGWGSGLGMLTNSIGALTGQLNAVDEEKRKRTYAHVQETRKLLIDSGDPRMRSLALMSIMAEGHDPKYDPKKDIIHGASTGDFWDDAGFQNWRTNPNVRRIFGLDEKMSDPNAGSQLPRGVQPPPQSPQEPQPPLDFASFASAPPPNMSTEPASFNPYDFSAFERPASSPAPGSLSQNLVPSSGQTSMTPAPPPGVGGGGGGGTGRPDYLTRPPSPADKPPSYTRPPSFDPRSLAEPQPGEDPEQWRRDLEAEYGDQRDLLGNYGPEMTRAIALREQGKLQTKELAKILAMQQQGDVKGEIKLLEMEMRWAEQQAKFDRDWADLQRKYDAAVMIAQRAPNNELKVNEAATQLKALETELADQLAKVDENLNKQLSDINQNILTRPGREEASRAARAAADQRRKEITDNAAVWRGDLNAVIGPALPGSRAAAAVRGKATPPPGTETGKKKLYRIGGKEPRPWEQLTPEEQARIPAHLR